MNISAELQSYIVEKGLLLSAIYIMFYLLSWRIDKNIWLSELSNGKLKENSSAYYIYLVLFFGVLVGFLNYCDTQLLSYNSSFSQVSLFVINIMIYGIYILTDLLVMDFLIYSKLQPKFMKLEEIDFVISPWHHLNYAFRYLIVGAFFSFVASMIS